MCKKLIVMNLVGGIAWLLLGVALYPSGFYGISRLSKHLLLTLKNGLTYKYLHNENEV